MMCCAVFVGVDICMLLCCLSLCCTYNVNSRLFKLDVPPPPPCAPSCGSRFIYSPSLASPQIFQGDVMMQAQTSDSTSIVESHMQKDRLYPNTSGSQSRVLSADGEG